VWAFFAQLQKLEMVISQSLLKMLQFHFAAAGLKFETLLTLVLYYLFLLF
jgi:hypothetical protein